MSFPRPLAPSSGFTDHRPLTTDHFFLARLSISPSLASLAPFPSHSILIAAMVRDFDDNEFPLAYLITFRSYGTWLHGDDRGSMDRTNNRYGAPRIRPDTRRSRFEAGQLKSQPVILDAKQRAIVDSAVREVCDHRHYILRAINVRTNHAHTIVSVAGKPEPVLNAFKSYTTRELRRLGLFGVDKSPWSRHGSTVYLWKPREVERGIDYVLYGQGDAPFWVDEE